MDEIYDTVLPEMAAHDIEDTIENRHIFLTGLRDGWKEDTDTSTAKSLYMMAINCEILILSMRLNNLLPK